MHLMSWGDHIADGEYVLHSRFSQALNFVRKGVENGRIPLLSLVTEKVGAGPINVVFRQLPHVRDRSLRISQNHLLFSQNTYEFDTSRCYNSSWPIFTFQSGGLSQSSVLVRRLEQFEKALVRHAPGKSLAALIEPERERYFRAGFEQAILTRWRNSVHELLHGNVEEGIHLMKGVGFGLTPGGDDFLAGFLLGLWLLQQNGSDEVTISRQRFYALSIGENLLSNTFLYCAKEGWLFERWKRAFAYLSGEQGLSSDSIIRDLVSVGETSGADTAVGFVLAIKMEGI
jgi:hypothetical protein